MLKESRKKVMQIANRLHYKSGFDRSTALAKAWKLIKNSRSRHKSCRNNIR